MQQGLVHKPGMLSVFDIKPGVLCAASANVHAAMLSELCILRGQLEAF